MGLPDETSHAAKGTAGFGRAAPLWVMVAALTSTFAWSQAFRTVPAIVVGRIGPEFGADAQALGLFAGAFSVAFGAMQLPIGIALDRWGPKRTICALFPFAIGGAILSALAPSFALLLAGQILLGIGSAPAYLSTLVFIARRYKPGRFAALSGLTMSLGGIGMLLTATPLAYAVERFGWRAAFAILGAGATLSLGACALLLDRRPGDRGPTESLRKALAGLGALFRMRQTAGILCLGAVLYGSFLAVRTPWMVPLFTERHGFTLVAAGNVVLTFSFGMLVGPVIFGRLDPGGRRRRHLMIALTFVLAAAVAALGLSNGPGLDWALCVGIAVMSGFAMLQYPDVRSSYPPEMAGRAMSVLNMAMFFGVALVQWLTGLVAGAAAARGASPIPPVFVTLGLLLVCANLAFWLLPWPRGFDSGGAAPPGEG